MWGRRAGAVISLLLIAWVLVIPGGAFGWEVDTTATVTRVIDGDTFDASPAGRIRLADIDAPEYYEPGYQVPKDYLTGLIEGELVYLDVDDIYRTDRYNRTVAVAYVRHNATHLLNVNAALLTRDSVVVSDYPNEFHPAAWSLYVVYATAIPPLDAAASAMPNEGPVPLRVNFSAVVSGGTPPYSFLWDFGDGATSSLSNPSYTYAAGGVYSVTMTVTDAAGHTTTDTVGIVAVESVSPAESGEPSASSVAVVSAGLLLGGALVVGFAILLRRRRRTPPRPK